MSSAQPAGPGMSDAEGDAGHSSLREMGDADATPDVSVPHGARRQGHGRRRLVMDSLLAIAKIIVLVASGVVLLVLGGGDGSFFRCDLAAAAICLTSSLGLGIAALVLLCRRRTAALPWEEWEELAHVFLDVNALFFLFLVLLAHALPVLLQLLTVAANISWVLFSLSVSAWIWRMGVEVPEDGEKPIMFALLHLPKPLFMGAWVILQALAVGTLYFKPRDKLDLSQDLNRFEHLVLTSLGSVYIVTLLGIFFLFLVPSGRRLTVFSGGQYMAEPPPIDCHAFMRAAIISIGANLFGAIFPAIIVYSIVTIVVLGMARLSLYWARPVATQQAQRSTSDEAGTQSRSARVAPMDEVVDIKGAPEKEVKPIGAKSSKNQKKIKVKEPPTCKSRCKKVVVTGGFVFFAFAKVALIFIAFIFDIVFIQKSLTTWTSRNFLLVKEDATCGQVVQSFSVSDVAECARRSEPEEGKEGVGFVFGKVNGSTVCSLRNIPVDMKVYNDFKDLDVDICRDDDNAWSVEQGLDFYAIQPVQSCSLMGRRLSDTQEQVLDDNKEASRYAAPDEIDEGSEKIFGSWFGDAMEWCLDAMKWVLDIRLKVPRGFLFKCRGARRLISASMVLASVVAVGAIAALDVLSVLAASKEITAVRAGECEGFIAYLIMVSRPQLLEMLVLIILQIAISSAVPFAYDAFEVFTEACGNLIHDQHMEGTACPNVWHLPVDVAATAILFFGIVGCVLLVLCVFGGLLYGLPPTQWASNALFGRYLQLANFLSDEKVVEDLDDASVSPEPQLTHSKTESLSKDDKSELKGCTALNVLRPLMGIPVSLGIWTSWSSRGYQIGRRQDWYEPVDVTSEEQANNGELVSWKSMYAATSKVVALAWLPLPLGLLMSKASLYLNEYVIFAVGLDGGGSRDEQAPIIRHFNGDTHKAVQLLHWITWAIQFTIILVIEFDLLPKDTNERLLLLSICIAVVVGIAVARVSLDIFQELLVFTSKKKVVGRCKELVRDREILEILDYDAVSTETPTHKVKDKDSLLYGLCESHYQMVLLACKELGTLEWVTVEQPQLPGNARSLLRSQKMRTSRRNKMLRKILDQLARLESQMLENAARGEAILVLHEAVDDEIQALKCRRVARKHCIVLSNAESQTQGQYLQRWAENRAKAEAVSEASSRQKVYQDAVRIAETLKRHGKDAEMPPEPVNKLQLNFSAAAVSISRVTGKWTVSEKELLDKPEEVRSTVSVHGEVALTWTKDLRHDAFDQANVTVNSVSHHIVIHGLTEEEQQALHSPTAMLESSTSMHVPHKFSFMNEGCEICQGELSLSRKTGCCSGPAASDSHDLEAGRQQWQLATLGVEWHKDDKAVDHEMSRYGSDSSLGGEGSPGSPEGGSVKHRRNIEDQPVAWGHAVSPAPNFTKAMESEETLRKLEQAIANGVGRDPQWLMGAFFSAVNADSSNLEAAEAARRAKLLAVASRMMRSTSKSRSSFTAPVEHVEKEVRPSSHSSEQQDAVGDALQKLRDALGREPLDADELSLAIDEARRNDVDPLLLARAEETFCQLVAKQKAALKLLEAIESRMIGNLRSCLSQAVEAGIERGEFPDESGVGVIEKAEAVLEEEKAMATTALEEALKANGALKLQRAIAQAEEVGCDEKLLAAARSRLASIEEKKRRINLLKMSLASNDLALLKAAIEECEKEGLLEECDKVDVNVAKQRLAEMERAAEKKAEEERKQEEANRRAKSAKKRPGGPLQQFRANAALRAALYSDPPQAVLLRLAITQAKNAGVEGAELERAEELVQQEAEKERLLEGLRTAAATHDIKALGGAIDRCRELDVDSRKMLSAITQLIEDQAKVARSAGSHGLGNVVLGDLEKERRDLHNQLQQAHGAIRVVCRVRPFLPSELGNSSLRLSSKSKTPTNAPKPSSLSVAGSQALAGARRIHNPEAAQLTPKAEHGEPPNPAVVRLDRHTICVFGETGVENTFRTSSVFGPDSIQAEVWNEIRSLVQSAVDGYNISLIACGPQGAGKTFTMLGGRAEGRGILPRLLDDLFAMRDRDNWRAELQVEAQLVEIYDSARVFDLLSRGRERSKVAFEASNTAGRRNSKQLVRKSSSGLERRGSKSRSSGFGGLLRSEARQAWVDSPNTSPRSPRSDGDTSPRLVQELGSVMTRRVADKFELQRLMEENMTTPVQTGRARQVLLVLHLTRTNRATSATTRSKIVAVDMAGIGPDASPEVTEAHQALHAVLEALTTRQHEAPFDSHVLTQVLQDCMGGSAKTVMLLALSPSPTDIAHSLATLGLAPVGAGLRPAASAKEKAERRRKAKKQNAEPALAE